MDNKYFEDLLNKQTNDISSKFNAQTEVLVERIQGNIKVFADGLLDVNRKIDTITEKIDSMDNRLERIENQLLSHDQKLRVIK